MAGQLQHPGSGSLLHYMYRLYSNCIGHVYFNRETPPARLVYVPSSRVELNKSQVVLAGLEFGSYNKKSS